MVVTRRINSQPQRNSLRSYSRTCDDSFSHRITPSIPSMYEAAAPQVQRLLDTALNYQCFLMLLLSQLLVHLISAIC